MSVTVRTEERNSWLHERVRSLGELSRGDENSLIASAFVMNNSMTTPLPDAEVMEIVRSVLK